MVFNTPILLDWVFNPTAKTIRSVQQRRWYLLRAVKEHVHNPGWSSEVWKGYWAEFLSPKKIPILAFRSIYISDHPKGLEKICRRNVLQERGCSKWDCWCWNFPDELFSFFPLFSYYPLVDESARIFNNIALAKKEGGGRHGLPQIMNTAIEFMSKFPLDFLQRLYNTDLGPRMGVSHPHYQNRALWFHLSGSSSTNIIRSHSGSVSSWCLTFNIQQTKVLTHQWKFLVIIVCNALRTEC